MQRRTIPSCAVVPGCNRSARRSRRRQVQCVGNIEARSVRHRANACGRCQRPPSSGVGWSVPTNSEHSELRSHGSSMRWALRQSNWYRGPIRNAGRPSLSPYSSLFGWGAERNLPSSRLRCGLEERPQVVDQVCLRLHLCPHYRMATTDYRRRQ